MKHFFLFLSLLLIPQISLSQDIDSLNLNTKKPKIGVVLSGGGAKGLAHIGVLKVIDSLGIKVDYIGGTSMGAIIGGLYASGYNAKQLDSIFSKVDTEALIQDYTPRDSKTFYEKRNDEIYALTLPFDKFKIGLPTALSKGLYNYNLLTRLTMHVSHVNEFSNLPIPFFCIATDVETGKEVVLESGILPQSMIASGAIPSLYNPIEIDGKLLVDGGVVNNYPVELVRAKGADIIIGVDVQDGLKDKDNLKGATGVLVQITNFSMIEKMELKRKLTDIYIKPDIKGYNVVSFDEGEEIIPKGVKAALSHIDELKNFENINYKNEGVTNFQDSIFIKKIQINGNQNYTRAYILGKLKIKENTKVSLRDLQKGINNLNATQNFSAINYAFEYLNENGDKLIVYLTEKKNDTYLRFGVHYDDLFKTGVLLNYTKKNLIAKNDVFSFDFVVGDHLRYNFNYYIDNGFYWSFGVNSKMQKFNRNVPNDFNNGLTLSDLGVNSINVDYQDLTNQAYLQTLFAQKFSIGAGLEHKLLKIESETVANIRPVFENSDYLSLFGYMKFDSFDQKYFPRKGWYFNGELKYLFYSSDYNNDFEKFTIAKADMGFAQTFFKKITLKVQSEGGFHVGEKTTNFFDFALGGYGFFPVNNLRSFYGYDNISIVGDSYVKGSVTLDYRIFKKHHFNVIANYANVGNKIFNATENWFTKPTYSGYAIGYGVESIIGPVEIKHSWSPETHKHFTWFSVGFWF
ncbi:patatin-like phospholipase family protein [Flavobacterium haoranii]|uniref:NTE family protein n=1 Tax=Flavobacterium haoranii TaxID=683124 RepID=A0A1M6E9A5_9FLAO|nr:patatin-like phospholipase family protein [Flavobacterium haoranii]SHI82066.1 NTE family protein [Flavobacterium haoranii]